MSNYWGGAQGELTGRQYRSLTGTPSFSFFPSDSQITVDPVGLVVSVETVKAGLIEYNQASDDLIQLLIEGVTGQVEKYLGRDLLTRTRKAIYFYPANEVFVTPSPVASITTVKSLDDEQTATTLTLNTDYYKRGLEDNVQLYNIDMKGNAYLEVVFVSGYGAAGDVPATIRYAVVQECFRQFKRRQDPGTGSGDIVDSLASETYALLRPYIIRRIA